jgi:LytS/YehU family sensor histidine kinase
MESAMKDLELKTIRSNLQPHFIFNSLNSIRALIDEDPELARKAITKISNILRSSITKQDATDSLENELKLVNDYLALEKIRFEERLSLTQDIDPASLPIQVPTMMLQTLVENAIKHGISSLEQGGRIHIKTSYTNHQLEIEVINSGTLNQDEANENSLGFGLSSTRQRLKLLYSNTSDLELFEQNGYVHVRVKIKTN